MIQIVLVRVSQEDIDKGRRFGSGGPCPVELAIRRALPWVMQAPVSSAEARLFNQDHRMQVCDLGPDGMEFVRQFDASFGAYPGPKPNPIDFWMEVEVPNEAA